MDSIKTFVEGKSDRQLIKACVETWFNHKLTDAEIVLTGGWTNVATDQVKNQMMTNEGVSLFILDADKDCESRRKEVLGILDAYDLPYKLFLFPNDKDNGAVEDLLMNIINSQNEPILDCWDKYVQCLKTKKIEGRTKPLTIPARKSEVYCYMETLLGETKKEKELIKDENRDFKNEELWDLGNPALEPLKNFLKPYFPEKVE